MKTLFKGILICLAVALLACTLASCGISEKDVIGTWQGSYVYEGNSFDRTIVIDADGTYGEVCYKNGSYKSSESGEWEISGKEVQLFENGDRSGHTPYNYSDGKLENNGHYFTKQ